MKIISYHIWKSFKRYKVIRTGTIDGTKFTCNVPGEYTFDTPEEYHARKNNMITMTLFRCFQFTIQFRDRRIPEYWSSNLTHA